MLSQNQSPADEWERKEPSALLLKVPLFWSPCSALPSINRAAHLALDDVDILTPAELPPFSFGLGSEAAGRSNGAQSQLLIPERTAGFGVSRVDSTIIIIIIITSEGGRGSGRREAEEIISATQEKTSDLQVGLNGGILSGQSELHLSSTS